MTDISPAAMDCAGWYQGNLLNASHIDEQKEALLLLGFNWDGDWEAVDLTKVNAPEDGNTFDFATLLDGITIIGIKQGGGGDLKGTGFFKINADNIDILTLNMKGASSAVLYSTGREPPPIPEPATWAFMLVGFGAVGGAMRAKRRKTKVTYSTA